MPLNDSSADTKITHTNIFSAHIFHFPFVALNVDDAFRNRFEWPSDEFTSMANGYGYACECEPEHWPLHEHKQHSKI